VIDLTPIHDLVEAGAERIGFDSNGVPIDDGRLSTAGSAVLHVAAVEEAVKRVEGETIVESVNRETLWSVRWFELDRALVLELGAGRFQPGDLIEAVKTMGHQWKVIPVSPSDP